MARNIDEAHDPIDKRPMRNPGQSLAEQIDELLNERAMAWVVVMLMAVAFIVMEWLRWLFNDQIRPVIYSLCGVIVILFALWRIYVSLLGLRNLRTGLLGELHVGQYLQNSTLQRGYWVVHDICEEGFNIDHALIGPGGVFSIETKARRKRNGDVRVDYDGKTVLVDGWKPDRDPVAQARASADRLQQILLEYAGKKVPVRPVVLFPGWYVNKQPHGCEVWVLNETSFVKFLDHEPEKLSREEITHLARSLGRYVREREEKRG